MRDRSWGGSNPAVALGAASKPDEDVLEVFWWGSRRRWSAMISRVKPVSCSPGPAGGEGQRLQTADVMETFLTTYTCQRPAGS